MRDAQPGDWFVAGPFFALGAAAAGVLIVHLALPTLDRREKLIGRSLDERRQGCHEAIVDVG